VVEQELREVVGHFSLCGERLRTGRDSADPLSSLHGPRCHWSGDEIVKVVVDIADARLSSSRQRWRAT